MPKLDNITIGIPGWVDAMVETTEQREALMKFYTSLYGWTWDVGDEQMGYYSIASLNGAAVMGIGQGPGGAGAMVPYFYTDDIAISAATATSLGGTVFMGPMEVPGAGVMALITDPTGAVHGLWQAREFQGFGVAYEPNAPGWFDHASNDP
jgi:predicted enzyme related to lactoylglutathione lyase